MPTTLKVWGERGQKGCFISSYICSAVLLLENFEFPSLPGLLLLVQNRTEELGWA